MELITIEQATANAMAALDEQARTPRSKARAWFTARRTAWVMWQIRSEERRQSALPNRIADAKYRAQLEYAQKLAEINCWGNTEKEKCKLELISLHNRIGIMQR